MMWKLWYFMLVCLCAGSLCMAASNLYWDVNPVDPNEQPGNGVWDFVTANWWDYATLSNVAYSDPCDSAFFEAGDGSPYTVTLAQDVQIGAVFGAGPKIKFQPGSDCTLAGPYTISIVSDPAILLDETVATIDCDIERIITDAAIRVNDDSYLTINGDVSVPDSGTGSTDDLVLGSKGYRQNFSTIEINGFYSHVSPKGNTYIQGFDPGQAAARADLEVIFGDAEIDVSNQGHGLVILSGGKVVLDGRMECDYIQLNNNASGDGAPEPQLRGSAAKTGTIAVKTADFNAINRYANKGYKQVFIANNRGTPKGGSVYTNNLNFEVDVTGLDFADPCVCEYKLANNGRAQWYGTFNSTYVVEPAGVVGTIMTFTPSTFQDPNEMVGSDSAHYFYLETADLDQSGCVDFADFAELANDWMSPCGGLFENGTVAPDNDWCGGADFNHSGMVDLDDLKLFVEKWLLGCGMPE